MDMSLSKLRVLVMDREDWREAIHGVTESDTTERLDWTELNVIKAPHSSTLAWKIPWTEEPGGLASMGSHRVRHDWSDLAAVAAKLWNIFLCCSKYFFSVLSFTFTYLIILKLFFIYAVTWSCSFTFFLYSHLIIYIFQIQCQVYGKSSCSFTWNCVESTV